MEHSIPDSFEKIVRMNPDRVAVKTKNLLLTYAELNRAANQIACAIVAQCGEEKAPVAVSLGHGADIIIAILALWKAGKIYVPLDPALPHARNIAILDATHARLVVSDTSHRDYIGQVQRDIRVINIDKPAGTVSAENLGTSIAPDNPAYVLFTSGSTGQPKGVMQNHRNVLNQIKRETNGLHICADDRLILVRSCSAIGGIRIVLSALLNGAAVYPINVARDGHAELADVLAREEITIYDSTPTTFRHFIPVLATEPRFPHLRLIRLSSEPVTGKALSRVSRPSSSASNVR
jgi:non-ribosomal peptide synthetase component F